MSDDKSSIVPTDVFAEMLVSGKRSPEEITADIQRQIMNANTLDEVLGEQKTTPIDGNPAILGRLLQFLSFEPREEGKFGWWVIINAVDVETGEIIEPPLATGGSVVLTQLAKLHLMGAFPFRGRFVEKQTSAGYGVLRLVGEESEVYEGEGFEEAVVISDGDVEDLNVVVEGGRYAKKGK